MGGAANPTCRCPLPWAQFLCGGAPPPPPFPPAEQFPYYKHLQMPSVCKYFHLQARCLVFTGALTVCRAPTQGHRASHTEKAASAYLMQPGTHRPPLQILSSSPYFLLSHRKPRTQL